MRTFREYVKHRDHVIDASQVQNLYDYAEIGVQLAIEWDEEEFDGTLFHRVNAVVDLSDGKLGLFNSALGKEEPGKPIIFNQSDYKDKGFPGKDLARQYPQLAQPAVSRSFPIRINVRDIIQTSENDMHAVKRIGGVAVHEATHAADYVKQVEIQRSQSPNLGEGEPERNRNAFEAWFDGKVTQIMAKYPKLKTMSRQFQQKGRSGPSS